ncbi:type II toxin-antitoxin system RelE/ParE family toxin [Candidatus Babeliales bacterium]|nr:type II toxin-antitoxin system RelE/ParE family toxin [Candidatus Babeliales bacterium]
MVKENKFKNYTIEFSKSAQKDFKKLNPQIQHSISLKLQNLKSDSSNLDIKKMQGKDNTYRIRDGKYRIIFEDHKHILIVLVIEVGLRGDVY